MNEQANKQRESTKHIVTVSTDCNKGPVYSEDGRLILNESFTDFESVDDMTQFDTKLQALLGGEDYIASWHIWDCYEQDWADIDLILHRFEMFDLVIKRQGCAVCTWRGAIDTYGRVLATTDPEENESKCWQWLSCSSKHSALPDVDRVETGRFGAVMQVSLVNDGPFTICLDTDTLS